jgi:hypothetical protein
MNLEDKLHAARQSHGYYAESLRLMGLNQAIQLADNERALLVEAATRLDAAQAQMAGVAELALAYGEGRYKVVKVGDAKNAAGQVPAKATSGSVAEADSLTGESATSAGSQPWLAAPFNWRVLIVAIIGGAIGSMLLRLFYSPPQF